MSSNLTVTEQECDVQGVRVFAIDGRIDADTAYHFDDRLKQIGDGENLVLDFACVAYMNSFGIGILVDLQKRQSRTGGVIKIANLSPSLRKIFQITYLTKVFEIFENLDSATASFR